MNPIPEVKRLWDAWDVRAMILLSFLLQIILVVLGNLRKPRVTHWVGLLLWLAYISADWVATAALEKLSSSACQLESGPSNLLRGIWASLLLLYLGGPDTITAYALEDNLLWKRHLLGLVTQTTLAIYVIVLSWTPSWLSLLNIPMFLVGIIKYLERTWSLYSASSKDSKKPPPLSGVITLANWNRRTYEEKIILTAHQWVALMRPDLKNFFSIIGELRLIGAKFVLKVNEGVRRTRLRVLWFSFGYMFDVATTKLEFMFDMLFTNSAIIYTKAGCILRLITFICSSFVLVFFLHSFRTRNSQDQQYRSSVDICITEILLASAVGLESYGLFLIISSDWFKILITRYLKRGIFSRSSPVQQHEKIRWTVCMGQFNLLSYCMSFGNGKGTKILRMIGIDEMLHKHWRTSFRDIPRCLKDEEQFIFPVKSITAMDDLWYHITRGELALEKHNCGDEIVRDSLVLDLGETIMIWHIATDICYHHMSTTSKEKAATCKTISDYMMYLLVMKSSMVYVDDKFCFGSLGRELRELLHRNINNISVNGGALIYQQLEDKIPRDDFIGSSAVTIVHRAIDVAEVLMGRSDTWDMMRSVWIEMMYCVALTCPHVSHLQHLRQGAEIISIYWLLTMNDMGSEKSRQRR